MENTYKNERSESVGSAFINAANRGVSITPPPYNNSNEKKKKEEKDDESGFEVNDYSNLVNKHKSPIDIKRSRIPQVAYGKERNLMVTFIDTNKEGEKEESTEFLERWGHKEKVYSEGVLIVECNEQTGVYKETISYNNKMFTSSERQEFKGGFGKLIVDDEYGEIKTYNFAILNKEEKIEALDLLDALGVHIYYSDFKKATINEVWEYDIKGDGTSFGDISIKTDVIRKYDSEQEYEKWKDNPKEVSKTNWMYKFVHGVKEKDWSLDGRNNENAVFEGLLLGLEGVLAISSLGGSVAAIGAAETWVGKLVAGAVLSWEVNSLTEIAGETILERLSKQIFSEYGEMGFEALNGIVEIYGDSTSIFKIITWDGKGSKYKLLWDSKSGIINGSFILMGENPYVETSDEDERK